MAGFVCIHEGETDGTINVGSRPLYQLLEFSIWCKSESPILAADPEFDPQSDSEGLASAINYWDLSRVSNQTIAEIGRFLEAATDPAHPYWSDNSKLFDEFLMERERAQGHDVDAMCLHFKTEYQSAFREVATLIQQRLRMNRIS